MREKRRKGKISSKSTGGGLGNLERKEKGKGGDWKEKKVWKCRK